MSKEIIDRALYLLTYNSLEENTSNVNNKARTFYGRVLQQCNIKPTTVIPTMGVCFNKFILKLELVYNPEFVASLSMKEVIAVLIHEMEHITRGHIYQEQGNKKLLNYAMDMEINQYIENLPEWAVMPDDSMSKFESYQYYYNLMKDRLDNDKCPMCGGDLEEETESNNSSSGENEGMSSNENNNPSSGENKSMSSNGKVCNNCKARIVDDHSLWGDMSKEDAIKGVNDLIQRTIQKNDYSYNDLPDHIKDLTKYLKKAINGMDIKSMLAKAIKKSVLSAKETYSWSRTSRRYGVFSQGSTSDHEPSVEVLFDTSGSISQDEFGKYLSIIEKLVKSLNAKIHVSFFHTTNYHRQSYGRGKPVEWDKIESGGTCLQDSFSFIEKVKPDLTFVLTDGYYGDISVKDKEMSQVFFLISKEGDVKHPIASRKWSKTLQMKD